MIDPMMWWCQDQFLQKTQPTIFEYVFSKMDKHPPSTINEHDNKEHWRRNGKQNTNCCSNNISLREFQKKL